jgi:hypothetical protein
MEASSTTECRDETRRTTMTAPLPIDGLPIDGTEAVNVTHRDQRLAAIAKYYPEKLPRLLAVYALIERMGSYRGS